MNRQMTVTQLSRYIKGVFDDEELLHDVTLCGEVADISYSDRHTFLVLSDGAYSVRCVHFSARDKIEKGTKIALRGSVDIYEKRNTVSFTYTEFFLRGVGDKNARLAELKQKLNKLGYFENRPLLPKYITDVAVVTSPDGAAIRDFLRVVHDKNPFVSVRVYPVKVQGEGAAAQIADAVEKLQSERIDAIVLCRGGGSDEDLDTFNDERLATAVATSAVPIISAVGHEIDYTLCDFCAGTRAGTPSIAGEIVNAAAGRIKDDIAYYISAVYSAVARKCESVVFRVNRLGSATTAAVSARIKDSYSVLGHAMYKCSYGVADRLKGASARLDGTARRMRAAVGGSYTAVKADTDKLRALLDALDPHRIIKVGYAAVTRRGERILGVAGLKRDDVVRLAFSDGTATAVISEVTTGKVVKEIHG